LSSSAEVEVLLATYNGERFLREQMESILAQDYENLRLLARDDGSSDATVAILHDFGRRFPGRVRILPTEYATGSARDNFLLLMQASTANYICFSDQDDVWLQDKVRRTMQAMDKLESRWGRDLPLLVFTDLRVVDDQLQSLHPSFWAHAQIEPARINRLQSLLRQNVVTGCTAMLNRRLVELALRMPRQATMHDHWIALLACTMGRSSILNAQTVLYRQHDRNIVGVETRSQSLPEVVHRIRDSNPRYAQWQIDLEQARALLRVHGAELPSRCRDLLDAYLRCGTAASRFVRIFTLIRYRFFRTGLMLNLATLVDLWKFKVEEHEIG
jgi:hypothetical protein